MSNNCYDKECRYLSEDDYDRTYCNKHNKLIKDDEEICINYERSKSCYNCKHSRIEVYETGTIDSIDYYCNLQDSTLIYSDISFMKSDYSRFPSCKIGKWNE